MGWRSRGGYASPPKGHFQKRLRRDGLNALLPRRLERNLRKRRLMQAARVRKRKQRDVAKRKRALRDRDARLRVQPRISLLPDADT